MKDRRKKPGDCLRSFRKSWISEVAGNIVLQLATNWLECPKIGKYGEMRRLGKVKNSKAVFLSHSPLFPLSLDSLQ
jgi:hypothetical protein